MKRMKTFVLHRPKLAAVLFLILTASVSLAAQTIKLSDGTFGTKVVVFGLNGTEGVSITGTPDVNIATVNDQVPLDSYTSGTLQNAAGTGNPAGSTLTVNGYSGVVFTVHCSTACTGGTTITLQGTEDGTRYATLKNAYRIGGADMGGVIVNQADTVPTLWYAPVSGLQAVRAPITNWSAGVVTVTARAVLGGGPGLPSAVSTSYTASAASTNATAVKTTPGAVTHYTLTNTTTTIYYLRMYNLAAAPTCSSSTGFVETIAVPPASAAGGAGGREIALSSAPQDFTTGIAFCLTGGAGSTDNTNAATGLQITIRYR